MKSHIVLALSILACLLTFGCASSPRPVRVGSPEAHALYSSMLGTKHEDFIFESQAGCIQFPLATKKGDRWDICYVAQDAQGLRFIRLNLITSQYEHFLSCDYSYLTGYALSHDLLGRTKVQLFTPEKGIEIHIKNNYGLPDGKLTEIFISNLEAAHVTELQPIKFAEPSTHSNTPWWHYILLNPFK